MTDERIIIGALLGAADIGSGPTTEQNRVIASLAKGYLGLDLDISTVAPIKPAELAAAVDDDDRHRVIDLLILVEFCRHPIDPAQADRVEAFVDALGGEDLALVARDVQTGHRENVMADWARFGEGTPKIAELPDEQVVSELRSLGTCPEGSLGRGLYDFYIGLGIPFPGEPDGGAVSLAHHDFTHVVTGYGTTPPDELALQAMLTASANFDHHFSGLVASLALFEAAAFEIDGFVGKEGVLDRPGAADELADAFRRGSACTGDFTTIDVMARRNDSLEAIRAEFGVIPVPLLVA